MADFDLTQTGQQVQDILNRAQQGGTIDQNISAKYTKPTTGIPKSDLASGVQTSVENADNSWDLLEALGLYRDADGYICERS